jgi:beta-lactam-binding protein with PASTA domain
VFKPLTNKPFWVNLLAAIIIAVLFLFLFLKMLGWLTKHGDYLKVPAVTGMSTKEAVKLLEKEGFEVYIQDSVYTDTAKRGVVLKQLPDPNATVKVNRTVFLTVNRYVPPMVDMPKLEGQSLSFAIRMLERNHLKLGDTSFRPDFTTSVLEQHYNGMRIPEKSKIQWGSRIDLIIGGGLEDKEMMVPSLTGMTYCDAKAYLEENGLSFGAIIGHGGAVSDTCSAFIVKQRPERFDVDNIPIYIRSGQLMDVWISQENKPIVSDSLSKQKDNLPKKKENKP